MATDIEAFQFFPAGMIGGVESFACPQTAFNLGLNLNARDGLLRSRPGFEIISGAIASGFRDSAFQGAGVYSLNSGDRIIAVCGGKVYSISVSTGIVSEYAGVNLLAGSRVYFCQVDKYFVIQDGESFPVILNDAAAFQPDPSVDFTVPVGTKMAYGHGRLFVVVSTVGSSTGLGERFFKAGDINLPSDGDYTGAFVPSVLKFTETEYLDGGGAFSLPNELGFISGLEFVRNAQTGTDYGSLIVFARNGACAFAVNMPRGQWTDADISQVLFTIGGTVATSSICPVNNDILYRSRDGIRSMGYSISASQGAAVSMVNDGIGAGVSQFYRDDTESHQERASACYADLRYVVTAGGFSSGGRVRFKYLIVFDGYLAAMTGASSAPFFEGAWTGYSFAQVLRARRGGVDRLFAVIEAPDGTNRLLALKEDEDDVEDYGGISPLCRCRLRAMRWPNLPVHSCRIFSSATIYLGKLLGRFLLTLYFKPYGFPWWISAGTASFCAIGAYPQRRRPVVFAPPSVVAGDVGAELRLDHGEAIDFMLEWSGRGIIVMGLLDASDGENAAMNACLQSAACVEETKPADGVEPRDDDYEAL